MKAAFKALLGRRGLQIARSARDLARAWKFEFSNRAPKVASDALPVPPARLLLRVAGTPDWRWFLESGAKAADSIRTAMLAEGAPIESLPAILDFGCGCGRVIRHFDGLKAAMHGCDLDGAAIRWCQRNLPHARFMTNRLAPPLPYGNEQFHLVYALSVFTHFPHDLQQPWIEELTRVVAPAGYLLMSVHGRAYLDVLSTPERDEFEAGQLVVRDGPPGSNQCAAYHPERYLRELVGSRFQVVRWVEEGAAGNPRQDLVLLKRA